MGSIFLVCMKVHVSSFHKTCTFSGTRLVEHGLNHSERKTGNLHKLVVLTNSTHSYKITINEEFSG